MQRPYKTKTVHLECKDKIDTSNDRGNWNHLRIIEKIPETWKVLRTLQKTAILGTAHLLRRVLMQRCRSLNMGHNFRCSIYCNYRTAAAQYTVETGFVSGI
jgi:hypothetical protein